MPGLSGLNPRQGDAPRITVTGVVPKPKGEPYNPFTPIHRPPAPDHVRDESEDEHHG